LQWKEKINRAILELGGAVTGTRMETSAMSDSAVITIRMGLSCLVRAGTVCSARSHGTPEYYNENGCSFNRTDAASGTFSEGDIAETSGRRTEPEYVHVVHDVRHECSYEHADSATQLQWRSGPPV